ncbi:MAG: FtsX-like permease family protein [Luteitalea sp.]|nr:FtsX-like permease family protein [Luteitalea sp.]
MTFDPRGVELASLDLSLAGYTDTTGPRFARELVGRVRELPGVQAATLADGATAGPMGLEEGLTVPGVSPPNGRAFLMASWNIVEPGYFATLRIPLVTGRDFNAADRAAGQPVVIVPESTARRLWPGQNPLGKHVLWQTGPSSAPPQVTRWMVVGVARDLKYGRDGDRVPPLTLYAPLQQRYTPNLTIIARTSQGQRITNEIRALVASMNPHLPILTARTLEDHMMTHPVHTQLRVAASVSGSVGIVGLLLATIGIYGVTAYAVTRRTREIGIRLALGARRADIVGMVLRQGLSLVIIGSAIGLMLAAAGSRLLVRLLFSVPPLDPVTFSGAALLFAVVGLVACYLPARRATRIDAMTALRYE